MNTLKQDLKSGNETDKMTEKRLKIETTTTQAKRLLSEQRDLTRIINYGQRDE